MSRKPDGIGAAVVDAIFGPVKDLGVKTVLARGGTVRGKVIGGPYQCRLGGCRGVTYSVRWPDGKLTRPCTEGMTERNVRQGLWQIQ